MPPYRIRHLFSACLFFTGQVVLGQLVTTTYILDRPPENVVRYDTACGPRECVRLRCGFGSAEILDTALVRWIREEAPAIEQVDLVFTSYRLVDDYDQRELNRKRLESLRLQLPELFENNLTTWRLVRQNGLKEAEFGQRFFHGFVLRLRRPPELPARLLRDAGVKGDRPLSTAEELRVMETYLSPSSPRMVIRPPKVRCTHYFEPRSRTKRERNVRFRRRSIWGRRAMSVCDTTFRTPVVGTVTTSYSFPDSVIFKVFGRDPQWKGAVIVEDVTGSMYPYTAQTLLWRRMQQTATPYVRFAFFNDGDDRPDGPVGRSGGAYVIASDSVAPIEETAIATMRKGNGGQGPENDIEAMLLAQSKFPDLTGLVLIADNWAPVRDLRLLSSVQVPVHVIICGSLDGRIHHNYIHIASATRGSVHTIEEDLDFMSGVIEGSVIHVGDQKFKVRKGELELIR